MIDFILSWQFLVGLAVGYLLLGQLLGLITGLVGGLGGKGGASPTGYPVNEGRY